MLGLFFNPCIYGIFGEGIFMKILWKLFCAFYTVFFTFRAFEEFMVDNPWWMLYAFFTGCYIVLLFDKN